MGAAAMERRSRLVSFGVGVVIVALLYLFYEAIGQTLSSRAGTSPQAAAAETDAAETGRPRAR